MGASGLEHCGYSGQTTGMVGMVGTLGTGVSKSKPKEGRRADSDKVTEILTDFTPRPSGLGKFECIIRIG